jgi:hypothetical protein
MEPIVRVGLVALPTGIISVGIVEKIGQSEKNKNHIFVLSVR